MDIDEFERTPHAGRFPEAVQRYLRLQLLEDLVGASSASGAARLLLCPPYEPLEALTLTFLHGEVLASHVVSDGDAWERLACEGPLATGSECAARERTFRITDLPNEMQGWRRIAEAIERAQSCMSDNPNGICYYHLAFGDSVRSMRLWFNPTEEANPLQRRLVEAYLRIKAGL